VALAPRRGTPSGDPPGGSNRPRALGKLPAGLGNGFGPLKDAAVEPTAATLVGARLARQLARLSAILENVEARHGGSNRLGALGKLPPALRELVYKGLDPTAAVMLAQAHPAFAWEIKPQLFDCQLMHYASHPTGMAIQELEEGLRIVPPGHREKPLLQLLLSAHGCLSKGRRQAMFAAYGRVLDDTPQAQQGRLGRLPREEGREAMASTWIQLTPQERDTMVMAMAWELGLHDPSDVDPAIHVEGARSHRGRSHQLQVVRHPAARGRRLQYPDRRIRYSRRRQTSRRARQIQASCRSWRLTGSPHSRPRPGRIPPGVRQWLSMREHSRRQDVTACREGPCPRP